jgi:hypothetical protein
MVRKFCKLTASPDMATLPTPLPSGGGTSAETLTLTVGSICEGSSSHASQPAAPTATVSSAKAGSETPLSSTPHVASVPSAQTSTAVPMVTPSTPAPHASSSATAKLVTSSGYSTEVESESTAVPTVSSSAPIRSSSPTPTPAKSNALRNNGLGTAIVAMAVALGTLVAM